MTSRTTLASLLAVFTLTTIAAASCGGTETNAPPPHKTTTSSGGLTTSGGGDMSTSDSSASGVGGSGGIGGGGSGGSGGANSCTDLLTNGKETDKDCGGPSCAPCPANLGCKVNADCVSNNCDTSIHKCAIETCTDKITNGKETDVDCGGGFCPGCGVAQFCNFPSDCIGGVCVASGMTKLCAASCSDQSKSVTLNETDVDCGGDTCPLRCDPGLSCNLPGDCKSKVCTGNICATAKCTDTIQNGTESDIDCGGGGCTQCEAAQKCTQNSDCRSNSCQGQKCACPAGMQPVPKKVGGGSYCIDTTEVTYAQYQVFYNANPTNLTLPAGCPGAGTYAPGGDWPAKQTQQGQRESVSFVDYCDAVAYCLYSGKHLCGKVDGGANAPIDATDANKSEWYNACSAQGASAYPYGPVYKTGECQGDDAINPVNVDGTCGANNCAIKYDYDLNNVAMLKCQGGAPNVWGMSGNQGEWEDSCDNANPPNCLVRGGSRCESGAAIACAAAVPHPRTYKDCDVGFRCCF